jgi:PPM family protein phosphatase
MFTKPSTRLRISGLTSPGKRHSNEDSFGVYPELGMALVSDGLGGHNAGGIASDTVIRLLPDMLLASLSRLDPSDFPAIKATITNTVVKLSLKINEQGQTRPQWMGMGATLVMMLAVEGGLLVTWMGDSRAYLMHNGHLQLVTDDHSLSSILISQGVITREQARTHPSRGRLSRYLGMPDEVYPDIEMIGISPGDRVLLCSDGLSDELDDATISELLSKPADPQDLGAELVYAAAKKGSKDNVTAVVAQWL